MDTRSAFEAIAEELSRREPEVARGRMMAHPALTWRGTVFAFVTKKDLVFKLGDAFEPQSLEIDSFEHLNPFKNKAPMRAWYRIAPAHQGKWLALALRALAYVRGRSSS